jgi:ABC-type transporter Mla subunit MlaD
MIEPSALVHRLDELRADVAEGERALRDLDARRDELVGTLLRLSGAVQVLEEVLAAAPPQPVTAP